MKQCPKCGKQFPDEANFCPEDAGKLELMAAPSSGAAVVGGRFALGAPVRRGRTGQWFFATDNQSGAACMVKRVDAHVFPSPLIAQRAERELGQLVRVNDAGVARVLGSGRDEQGLWYATEPLDGMQPLSALVGSGGIDPQRATELVVKIGSALGEAAKTGVIHRDLAPKNILVGADDRIKLINFAIPVPLNAAVQGVPEFVAPEIVEGKPADQRANIYSLGSIYYYLLTGRPPFEGSADEVLAKHLNETPPPPSAHAAVPADVDTVVARALERSSAKRYMTLRQFVGEVEALGHSAQGSSGSTQPMGRVGDGGAVGKQRPTDNKLAQTMMGGFGAITGDDVSAATAMPPPQTQPSAPAVEAPPAAVPAMVIAPSAASLPASAPMPQVSQPAPVQQPEPVQQRAPVQPIIGDLPSPAQVAGPSAPTPAASAPSAPAPAQGAADWGQGRDTGSNPAASGKGKGKAKTEKPSSKKNNGKFRETMWFKKGELDAAAAEASAGNDDDAKDKADSLPEDERYKDDGSLTNQDQERYSLRTGGTQAMMAMSDHGPGPSAGVSEDALIDEMKAGRGKIFALIGLGIALLIAVIVYAAMGHKSDPAESPAKPKLTPPAEAAPATGEAPAPPAGEAPAAPAGDKPADGDK